MRALKALRSPLIPIVLGLAALSFGIIWLTRPEPSSGMLSAAAQPSFADSSVRVVIDGVDRTEEVKQSRAQPYAARNPGDLTWSQVNYITRRGSYPVLMFNDGSQLQVDAYVRDLLPSDIRFRLEYEGPSER